MLQTSGRFLDTSLLCWSVDGPQGFAAVHEPTKAFGAAKGALGETPVGVELWCETTEFGEQGSNKSAQC